jgi:hypothetical protein
VPAAGEAVGGAEREAAQDLPADRAHPVGERDGRSGGGEDEHGGEEGEREQA